MSLERGLKELANTIQELLDVVQEQNETIIHLRKENLELCGDRSIFKQASLPKLKKNSSYSSFLPAQDTFSPK